MHNLVSITAGGSGVVILAGRYALHVVVPLPIRKLKEILDGRARFKPNNATDRSPRLNVAPSVKFGLRTIFALEL